MQPSDDNVLLRQYAESQSDEAFTELVARYINLVYSVALRQVGNPSHAEEIAQAVFIILAKKASSLRHEKALSSWLFQTTRLTANNFIRSEIRRQRREQEAFMQSTQDEPADAVWQQIGPALDDAVASLSDKDRRAILLRYYEGRNLREVGAALGVSEGASEKRVTRALEKLQKFFFKRRLPSATVVIGESISANSVQAAPAGLAKTISAAALAKGVAASASTLTLVKGALKVMAWTKAKIAIAAGVATAIIGAGTCLVYHLETAHAATGGSTFVDSSPVQINNSDFKPDGNQDGTFVVEVDPKTLRTTNSAPAIHIRGPLAPDEPILQSPVTANGSYKKTDNSSSTKYLVTDGSVLYGKHVRITGWLKTKDVRGWVGAFVIIMGVDGRRFPYDDMSDRPICGTTDWQQIEIVTDLPDEPCIIYFGPDLYGPGELWGDDFEITPASPGMPITDDRNWRIASESDPTVYSENSDFSVTHDGHRTVCLTYTPDGTAPRGTNIRWSHDFYGGDSDKYCGHTVRMSGWIKTENVSGRIEPVILPFAGWNKLLAKYSSSSLRGTHDWTQFSVTCAVPADTEYLRTGFNFFGSGKAWIDTNSLKFEIVRSW